MIYLGLGRLPSEEFLTHSSLGRLGDSVTLTAVGQMGRENGSFSAAGTSRFRPGSAGPSSGMTARSARPGTDGPGAAQSRASTRVLPSSTEH